MADSYVYDAAGQRGLQLLALPTNFVVKKGGSGLNRECYLRFDVPVSSDILLGASLKGPRPHRLHAQGSTPSPRWMSNTWNGNRYHLEQQTRRW